MVLPSTLQSTTPNYPSSSSTLSYSLSFPSGSALLAPLPLRREKAHHSIKCSYSRSRSQRYRNQNRSVKFERRLMLTWNDIYKRISNPEAPGVASVLDQIEKEGQKLLTWELSKVVRELRNRRRYDHALEVYDWMNNRMWGVMLSSSDTATHLDLIAKVRGVSSAEDYFIRIPDTLKDYRIYGALLNAYVGAKVRDKAEILMVRMRNKGYAKRPLPFNVMMTLYMKLREYDKVEELVSEMRNTGIRLDLYSYNIWMSSRAFQGSAEGMEDVFRLMLSDSTIDPSWSTLGIMASFFIKFGQLEKAEQFMKHIEIRMPGQGRMPYDCLMRLYARLGKKGEVYRVWNMYKSIFPSTPNRAYHDVIYSVIRMGDIEGAEKIYEEWLSMKARHDPRVGNLLMSWYAKKGSFDKVKGFFDRMVKAGGKPNSRAWEIFAVAHMKEGRISEALSCFKEAVFTNVAGYWKPKPTNISAFLELCEKEADAGSKEIFVGLLRKLGCFQDGSMARESGGEVGDGIEQLMPDSRPAADDETEERISEESAMLPSVAEWLE